LNTAPSYIMDLTIETKLKIEISDNKHFIEHVNAISF